MRARAAASLMTLWLAACGGREDDTAPPGFTPDLYCPGSAGCADADGALEVGVARADVTPRCYETWTDVDQSHSYNPNTDTFFDCGCDRLCPGDAGYPGPDAFEGDGAFHAVWIAGFQSGRAMTGPRDASLGLRGEGDGLTATALAVRRGETTLVIVAADAFGWMLPFTESLREAVAAEGLDVDHVVVHSSHGHQTPDTLGIYGPSLTRTGVVDTYVDQVRADMLGAIRAAVADLRPAQLAIGRVDVSSYHPTKGVRNVNNDTRDPFVVDEGLEVAVFREAGGDAPIATVVHYSSHPEAAAGEHTVVSSDFAHALRLTIEQGVSWQAYQRDGIGGLALLLNGTVGGMQTPLRIAVTDPDGNEWQASTFEKADVVGSLLGEMALDAVEAAEPVADPALAFRTRQLYLPIENAGFQSMFLLEVLDREAYNYDPEEPFDDDNVPEVRTEVDLLELGPIRMLTVPGEMLPELAIGGYDGSHVNSPGYPLVQPDNPNPPDLAAAPAGPYLLDHVGGAHPWIVGLGNDQLGYIIPAYDFVLDDAAPYIFQADGDHYEETNSLGPQTAERLEAAALELLEWSPPG